VIDYYGVMAKKLGVEVRLNTEANAKFMRSVLHEYDVCIVAAGARTDLAVFQYLEGSELLVDALEVAHGRFKPGKRVVMIGGGMIGLTISEFLAKAGHEVTVVEKDKRIGGDIMPTFKWRHTAWVDELGIKTVCSAQLVKVTKEGATVKTAKGEESSSPATTSSSPARAGQPRPVLRVPVDDRRVARRRRRHGAARPRSAIQEGYRLGVSGYRRLAFSRGGKACPTAPMSIPLPATTCRRPRQQPEFLFDLPELKFPERMNCATELLDRPRRAGARRACLHPGAERPLDLCRPAGEGQPHRQCAGE
jgi:hypothetical protein